MKIILLFQSETQVLRFLLTPSLFSSHLPYFPLLIDPHSHPVVFHRPRHYAAHLWTGCPEIMSSEIFEKSVSFWWILAYSVNISQFSLCFQVKISTCVAYFNILIFIWVASYIKKWRVYKYHSRAAMIPFWVELRRLTNNEDLSKLWTMDIGDF